MVYRQGCQIYASFQCLFGLRFEVSSAKLERSYRRAPRGAQSKNDDPAGICHLCVAGMPGSGLEWEDPYQTLKKCLLVKLFNFLVWLCRVFWFWRYSVFQVWVVCLCMCVWVFYAHVCHPLRQVARRCMENALTVQHPDPWESEAPFTKFLMINKAPNGKATFHRPDIWHTVHLGIAKHFLGSCMSVIQKAIPGSSIPTRFAKLGKDYAQFCRDHKLQRYVSKFDERLFNISGNQEPVGTWNKASCTTNMCKFLQHLFVIYKDPILALNDDRTKFMDPLFA